MIDDTDDDDTSQQDSPLSDDDQQIGRRLRIYRASAEKTQRQLADHLGVTYQQLQKYETGANRIPLALAVRAASLLRVSIGNLSGEDGVRIDVPVTAREVITMRKLHSLNSAGQAAVLHMIETLNKQQERPE